MRSTHLSRYAAAGWCSATEVLHLAVACVQCVEHFEALRLDSAEGHFVGGTPMPRVLQTDVHLYPPTVTTPTREGQEPLPVTLTRVLMQLHLHREQLTKPKMKCKFINIMHSTHHSLRYCQLCVISLTLAPHEGPIGIHCLSSMMEGNCPLCFADQAGSPGVPNCMMKFFTARCSATMVLNRPASTKSRNR